MYNKSCIKLKISSIYKSDLVCYRSNSDLSISSLSFPQTTIFFIQLFQLSQQFILFYSSFTCLDIEIRALLSKRLANVRFYLYCCLIYLVILQLNDVIRSHILMGAVCLVIFFFWNDDRVFALRSRYHGRRFEILKIFCSESSKIENNSNW